MKLLANENIPSTSISVLRDAGMDVVAASEIMPRAADVDVMRFAAKEERLIVTMDRDYGELVYRYREPIPGVLYLRLLPLTPTEMAERLLICLTIEGLAFENWFTVVERLRVRQRRLHQPPDSADST